MKYGTFTAALIKYIEGDSLNPKWSELKHVHMTIYGNGFAEIIHFENGIREPNNKRTMVIPASSIISFIGYGYAN